MKAPARLFFMILILTLLVGSYQNCSVYKSEGRKYLEQYGVTREATSTTASAPASAPTKEQAGVQPHCRPYFESKDLDRIFLNETEARMYFDFDRQALTCVLSSVRPLSGSDLAVCTITARNLELFRAADSGDVVDDPHPNGPLSLGSFGVLEEREDSPNVRFTFVGAKRGAMEAAACTFTFESRQKYEASADVVERASLLVHQIIETMN